MITVMDNNKHAPGAARCSDPLRNSALADDASDLLAWPNCSLVSLS